VSASDPARPALRQVLLAQTAQAEAIAWTAWWRNELRRQNRPVSGGWPGTLSEARVRVARRIAVEHGPTLAATRNEVESAAREAYGAARDAWNDSREPEPAEPDDDL
jgi:hypothetical protein